jgi:sulfur relay (sulfurtransferase) DsrC/TusE family protein
MPILPKFVILCPSCNSEFISYEIYISHVFEKHQDQPSLRMQAKVIKKKIDEDSANLSQSASLKEE